MQMHRPLRQETNQPTSHYHQLTVASTEPAASAAVARSEPAATSTVASSEPTAPAVD